MNESNSKIRAATSINIDNIVKTTRDSRRMTTESSKIKNISNN